MNVRNHTSTGNGSLDEGIEFFISTNGELQVTRSDTLDLEVLAGISGQLEDFGSEVLQNGRSVNGGGGSDTVSLVDRVLEETVDTTDGELKSSLARTRLRGLLGCRSLSSLSALSSFAFSGLSKRNKETRAAAEHIMG